MAGHPIELDTRSFVQTRDGLLGRVQDMSLVLRAAAVTDIGLSRGNNEDSAYVGVRLAVVADGIGGMPAGEQASAIVVRELEMLDPGGHHARDMTENSLPPLPPPAPVAHPGEPPTVRMVNPADPLAALRDAVARANRQIRELIDADDETSGMGTTVTALMIAGDQMAILHVGDSRGYRLKDGTLEQVTRDDTYVQTLVEEGLISADEAKVHPRRSVVMQAVQGLAYEPTCTLTPATVGDRYLLCSDGLSDVVPDESIQQALEMEADPTRCAQLLVRLALQAGAPDNVTVIVADVVAA